MLIERTLYGVRDKVQEAIDVLRDLEPPEGYYLADSGGKDSDVILALAKMSGVKFDAHHNLTTIDPPEVIYHMREHHKETQIDRPDVPFLQKLVKKGFPQRQRRWCCAEYKERGGNGRFVITGVRAQESAKRAGRKMVEICYRGTGKRYLNIIRNWTDDEVWEFHRKYNIPYCKLYDEGWKRIGCLFCPNAGKRRLVEVEKYPKYEQNFRVAFTKLYQDKIERGFNSVDLWKDGNEMFDWWINENKTSDDPDQGVLFE